MTTFTASFLVCALFIERLVAGSQQPDLDIARGIDKQILNLSELSGEARRSAIWHLAAQIRAQPAQYFEALAFNLVVDGEGGSDTKTNQLITNVFAESLSLLPHEDVQHADSFDKLAELVRYDHLRTSLKDPRLRAAFQRLRSTDRKRSGADFALRDLAERNWNLKALRGQVVLVNFWASWCPPCREEISDLNEVLKRFGNRGFQVLGISDEDRTTQVRFRSQRRIDYPLLLDPAHMVKDKFLVRGIPKCLVYNRSGHLVAESIDKAELQQLLAVLAKAGLR